jgi:hypothetical protein
MWQDLRLHQHLRPGARPRRLPALLLYVRYETSYDNWLPDSDRVYQVQTLYADPITGARSLSRARRE